MAIGHRRLSASAVPQGEFNAFARDALEGLSAAPKRLPCKWLYDARGSELIAEIMDLEEYDLTRAETEIFEAHKGAIAEAFGSEPFNLVDLGAGDGRKTGILIREFLARGANFEFYSIDISEAASRALARSISTEFPTLGGSTLVAEYGTGLAWLANETQRRNLVLFLGSNIGNSNFEEARGFVRELWLALEDGDRVLIGFDARREIERMVRAYDDSKGITAAFNLNLLARMNRELAADFQLDRFRFYCTWEPRSSAIESYLVSLVDQTVSIGALKKQFAFEAGEAIHTESSRKYTRSDIERLATDGGFASEALLTNSGRTFVDALWRVEKAARKSRARERGARSA